MQPNAMKHRLRAGEPALGLSIMIPSPQLVEMAGALGFDWVLLDCEHGTLNPETVELLVMAATGAGITPIARPAVNRADAIAMLLDRGAMGLQVPHVATTEDARRAVTAAKFHPLGSRSLAAGTRPSGFGLAGTVGEFIDSSNRETLICVQLEDETAIDNADDILAQPGIDVFFIGPSDLSQSMGHPGQSDHPRVRRAIDDTLGKIRDAGLVAGMPATTRSVASLIDQGVRYIYTHLPHLLQSSAREFFTAAGRAG